MEERNTYHGYQAASGPSGMMLRDMRNTLHLSREAMAKGICSVTKYARIESGEDVPTEIEFSGFMNRLGEPSLYYGDLFTKGNEECLALRAQIREEALLDNWDKVSEYLCSYSQYFPPVLPEEKQFFGFYETVYCYITNDDMDGLVLSEMCHDLMMLGRPDFHSSPDITFVPTQAEFLLMNAIAVGFSECSDHAYYEKARSMLISLLLINKKRYIPNLCRNTRIGLLLNLCMYEVENSDLYRAERHLDLLFHNFSYTGGSHLYARALMCKADILEKTGRALEASELRHSMYSVFHVKCKKSDHKVLVF